MHKKKYDSLIILIPSFNELNNLKKFIKEIHKRYKVLIIDDCSSDNTSTWLKKNKINFIKNKKNIGYEQSLIKGLKILSKVKKVEKIITMDADGQHKIKHIKKFINVSNNKNPDLIIGSRKKKNRFIESIISKIFQMKYSLEDPLSGFKLYKREKLKEMKFDNFKKFFLVDLVLEFIKKKHKVISINIETNKRFDNPKVGDLMDTNFKMLSILACVILN
jgi:glycosyltransferase involved in cell wall biosynthesis|tara:strand:+ start:963 stop:1619 length:657 start_codon:yes stop_codon:yes gene_type:complete